ncbi:MAG: sialidase family protein, partial [Sodaliphilus sp.]|nr:sialidase family protein [Sodaliphilus sp.]
MSYFKKLKKSTGRTRFLLALLTLLFGFSANAATYKVSDTPADLANLENGAKVVMYNIGAEKLVGYNNGEVSKKEIAVTDDDRAAYVFTVKKSGSTVALVNSTSYGPQASYSSKNSKFSFKWSTAPNYFAVYSGSNYTQLYVTGARNNGYLAFSNSKMTVTTSGNYETSKWNFYEVTQETSGSTGDGAQTVHKQLKAWQTDAGYQEVGYIGLGNKNQVLAMACVSVSADDVPTLTYRLFGHTGYLSAISVYARERDTKQDYTPDGDYAKYENTFAHIFDYRNPEKNCGALFLGTTHEVPAAGEKTTFTSNLKLPAGEYVIYLVANVRSAEEIGGLKNLPLIGGAKRNFTRVGGVIDMVSNKTINTVNNYSGEGGGRVLVPKFKLLYAPRYEDFATSEEYSRYYRIPAITRASDGTLVALSDARKMHIHDVTNSIDVVSRRSSDNGKTWSDYVVIFQGSQSGEDCYDWKGYGDAAVASFANGTVIATAIHGFGLAGSSTDPATDVVWKVSRDNGKSWSSEYTMDQKLFGGLRGNISPGNICVANEGYIKGKALVGLRTSTSPNNGYTNTSASHQRIYCLTYDPDKNTWTNVTTGWDNYNYIEVSGDLDETQFVQIGDNEYLMSARYYGTGFRKFYRLKFTSATTATVTEVSQSGMTLAGGCNGDLINYTTANQGTYVIHTIPKDWAENGDNCRTSLSAYYTKSSTSGSLNWTRSLDLFDPFDNTNGGEKGFGIGAMDETAQYSSLSMQEDGTIAVLMEAYPYAIRHIDQASSTYKRHWGDWVMGQYYINLRIGDIVDGAEQPDPVKIDAPVISPNSSTYDSYNTKDRPTITISHQNYVNYPDIYDVETAKVNTLYDFEFFNAKGVLDKQVNLKIFQTESASFTWEEVYKAMGYTSDPASEKKGWYLRVSAYCVSDANSAVVSNKDVKIYTFANPVRRIKVVGLPTSGASKTELSTQGNTVGSDVWLTVGVDQEVRINAPALYPFKFKGFYYEYKMNGADNEQVKLSQKLPYNEVSGMQHQITFTVPFVEALADNHNDEDGKGLVIYAVYDVEAGFSTRVNTQYNNGLNSSGIYESQYSYWTPSTDTQHVERIQGAVGGTPLAKNLVIPVAENQNNTHIGGTGNAADRGLTYPQALNYGLDAFVTLVPDSRAAKYLNAIIRVK